MANPVLSAQYNASTSTLTVTLNNPPSSGAPTTAVVTLLGQPISVPLTSNVGTLAISVHPSIASSAIPAQVSIPAGEQLTPPIGTVFVQLGNYGGPASTLQLGAPAASGDPYWVWPTTLAQLQRYYAGLTGTIETAMNSLAGMLQPVYTSQQVHDDILVNLVLPALQSSTYTPITLSADQSNALAAWKASVTAKNTQTLGTIYPSGGSESVPFQGLIAAAAQFSAATKALLNDLATIPNLTA